MVDTNTDPTLIDFPIPANDDASSSIDAIVSKLADAIIEGLKERTNAKNSEKAATKDAKEVKEVKETEAAAPAATEGEK
jgi:small subunit ribosomal protein S2